MRIGKGSPLTVLSGTFRRVGRRKEDQKERQRMETGSEYGTDSLPRSRGYEGKKGH